MRRRSDHTRLCRFPNRSMAMSTGLRSRRNRCGKKTSCRCGLDTVPSESTSSSSPEGSASPSRCVRLLAESDRQESRHLNALTKFSPSVFSVGGSCSLKALRKFSLPLTLTHPSVESGYTMAWSISMHFPSGCWFRAKSFNLCQEHAQGKPATTI